MKITPGRYSDTWDEPLLVFIIGMRINHFWQLHKWLPVARAMPRMILELYDDPASGFIGAQGFQSGLRIIGTLQYWRDFESLEAYSRAQDRLHWPAWAAFNKAIGDDGAVGIFHETYVVPPGGHETIYGNMVPFGLGQFTGLVPAAGSRKAARERMIQSAKG